MHNKAFLERLIEGVGGEFYLKTLISSYAFPGEQMTTLTVKLRGELIYQRAMKHPTFGRPNGIEVDRMLINELIQHILENGLQHMYITSQESHITPVPPKGYRSENDPYELLAKHIGLVEHPGNRWVDEYGRQFYLSKFGFKPVGERP